MPQVPVVLIGLIAVVIALIAFAASRYKIAKPNEALIIAGSKRSDGGIKVVVGGGAIVYPLINVARRITLEVRSIQVGLNNAISSEGIPVHVEGIVNVKIDDNADSIKQAAQRFLDSQNSIPDVVRNVLEGSLRQIIGQLTVVELIRDRDALATRVQEVANGDLQGTGLVIDVFTIQSIQDTEQYIENLGRKAAAEVKRDAEIAEAETVRQAREKQEVARQSILEAEKQTQLKEQAIAQEVATATAKAEQAKPLADAEARKAVVLQETEVAELAAKRREKELDAEVRAVANAERYEQEQQAEGRRYAAVADAEAKAKAVEVAAMARALEEREVGVAKAEAIKAVGLAEADAMTEKAAAYKLYDESAQLEMIISRLPEITAAAAQPLENVDNITIIDSAGASKLTQGVFTTIGQADAMLEALTGKKLSDLVLARAQGTDGEAS